MAKQWGLVKVQAPQAWRYSRGRNVLVAVIDSGVDASHEDLKGKVVVLPGSNFDCDVSTAACRNDARPSGGHGTAVAGIVAARQGNGKGIAGVAPDARLLAVKARFGEVDQANSVLRSQSQAIRFAADHGARVIHLSANFFPGVHYLPGSQYQTELSQALDYAWARGSVLVAPAGNLGVPMCGLPGAHARVLCVGAVDSRDLKIWYSDFGEGIDLVAPSSPWMDLVCTPPADALGGYDPRRDLFGIPTWPCQPNWPCDFELADGIWTTALTAQPRDSEPCEAVPNYGLFGGTSAAAPFVSGVAALLAAKGLTNSQIVQRIEATADDLGAPGWDPVYGWGRVNALRAVRGR